MRASTPARDDGAILLLTIGYALIAIALIVVAVDASAFFLSRRSLAALADGAAVAGTHAEDADQIYAGTITGTGSGADLPLAADGVRAHVVRYLADRDTGSAPSELYLADVGTDGRTVSVSLAEDKALPFLGLINSVTGAFPGGTARIEVTARARAPLGP